MLVIIIVAHWYSLDYYSNDSMCIFSFFCVSVSQSVIDQVWLAIPACQYDAVFNLQCEQIQSFDHPDCMYACMEF